MHTQSPDAVVKDFGHDGIATEIHQNRGRGRPLELEYGVAQNPACRAGFRYGGPDAEASDTGWREHGRAVYAARERWRLHRYGRRPGRRRWPFVRCRIGGIRAGRRSEEKEYRNYLRFRHRKEAATGESC